MYQNQPTASHGLRRIFRIARKDMDETTKRDAVSFHKKYIRRGYKAASGNGHTIFDRYSVYDIIEFAILGIK
jgi:hypothetical protein